MKAASGLIANKEEDSKIVGVQVLSRISESTPMRFVEDLVCK